MAEDKEKTGERGYGNIYTPHAGAMIIHVQRESGLANRTIIFTQRQVRLFRISAIVLGSLIAFGSVSWFFLAAQAARVPLLTRRVERLQHDVARVDTLQRSLNELASRFQQVQHMMGNSSMTAVGDTSKTKVVGAAAAAVVAAAPVDTVIVRPDEWPLPMAGTLLPSDSKALEIAVPLGTEIRAAGAGSVVEVSDDSTLGKLVRISHRSGYETVYAGASEVRVSKGQHVAAGSVIALSGDAPGTLEPHLHFEMRRHGVAIDASSVIKRDRLMAIFNKDSKGMDDNKNLPANSNALSIIAAGTKIQGDIDTDGVVKIEGRVEGGIRAARQVLVGRQGEVLGDINTREAVIGGRVQGTINASDRVEVQGTSVIIGDINTRALAVIEGGRINGSVRIADAKEPGSEEQIHPSPVAVLR